MVEILILVLLVNLLASELFLFFLPFSFSVQCLCSPHGIVYLAAKKHYFGVGGGSRRFISIVEKDGALRCLLLLLFLEKWH